MMPRLSINQDSIAGLLFVLAGAAGLWIGRKYPVGTAMRMGPGYFPLVLCWLLIIFGLGIGLKGVLAGGEGLTRWSLRPLVFVLLSFVAFGTFIERFGLPVAAASAVLIGAMGGREFRWGEQILLSVGLAVASSALFIYALGLPMQLWPS
jgi:hypothetical protein